MNFTGIIQVVSIQIQPVQSGGTSIKFNGVIYDGNWRTNGIQTMFNMYSKNPIQKAPFSEGMFLSAKGVVKTITYTGKKDGQPKFMTALNVTRYDVLDSGFCSSKVAWAQQQASKQGGGQYNKGGYQNQRGGYQKQNYAPPQNQGFVPQQQGFAPPQQQGFAPQNQAYTPPQQQGFAPQQNQGFVPPQNQGFQPQGQPPQAQNGQFFNTFSDEGDGF